MMKEFLNNSYLFGGNAPFIEDLYEKYLVNPASVPSNGATTSTACRSCPAPATRTWRTRRSWNRSCRERRAASSLRRAPCRAEQLAPERLQVAALLLVTAYRIAGSRWATVDPLKRMPRPNIPELEPAYYDLKEADLDQVVNSGSFVGLERVSLRNAGPGAARHLLPQHRLRVHVHLATGRSASGSRSASSRCAARRRSTPEEQKRLLQQADRGRAPRALSAHALRRPEALLARRRREPDSVDRRADPARRRAPACRRSSSAWRTAAGSTCWSTCSARCRRTCSRSSRASAAQELPSRRRQVPQRLLVGHHHAGRAGAPVARVQPLAPGDRQPGGRGLGARAPAPPQRQDRRPGAADPGARRRRVRRAGRGDGDAQPVRHPRLRHRRHGAPDRQQPDRLHHLRPARRALDASTAPTWRRWSRRRSST